VAEKARERLAKRRPFRGADASFEDALLRFAVEAVRQEIELLSQVRERANYVINTTDMTLGQLQAELYRLFVGGERRPLAVKVLAFGFKYGLPIEADMVLDVRFLPNPYYVPNLREKSGLDEEVRSFLFGYQEMREFMELLTGMVDFLMPQYTEEGKHDLTIAVGCTGGRHRSVAVAAALAEHITSRGQQADLVTRDIDRG